MFLLVPNNYHKEKADIPQIYLQLKIQAFWGFLESDLLLAGLFAIHFLTKYN